MMFLSNQPKFVLVSLFQMNEKNLGVCFAPSLFHLCGTKEDPSSPKRQKRTPMNKASKELTDNLVGGLFVNHNPNVCFSLC